MNDRAHVSRLVSSNGTLIAAARTEIHSGFLVPRNQNQFLHYDPSNPDCYPGSGTAVTDLSGSGNNGTFTNGVGFSNDGGGCFTFDGTNDFIDIPHNNNQNSQNITIIAWVKRFAPLPTTNGQVIGKSFNEGYRVRVAISGSNIPNMQMFDRGSTGGVTGGGGFERGFNHWTHIAAVFSQTPGREAYRNGVKRATNNIAFGGYTSTGSMGIGNGGYSQPSEPYWGNISLVQCWNVALTGSEIWQHFNATRWRYGI